MGRETIAGLIAGILQKYSHKKEVSYIHTLSFKPDKYHTLHYLQLCRLRLRERENDWSGTDSFTNSYIDIQLF